MVVVNINDLDSTPIWRSTHVKDAVMMKRGRVMVEMDGNRSMVVIVSNSDGFHGLCQHVCLVYGIGVRRLAIRYRS